MLTKITDFIKRPTSRHIIINTVGNYLNVFFTAFFALLLVRILSPSEYGVLSVLLGISYVLANVLDFGTSATLYSYLPSLIEKKAANIYQFLKTNFLYQLIFSLIVITLLFVFFPYLDKVFFKTKAPPWELYVTTFSVLFLLWQNFILNCLFAAKKFFMANLYLNLSNVLKTVLIFILIFFHKITIGNIIFIFGILGPIIFFLLVFLDKRHIFKKILVAKIEKEEFRFGYTVTFFIANQFFNLGTRMDLFLLSYFRSKPEVGYYGVSQKIILTILTSITSITQVLSPSFSRIKTKKEAKHHLKTGFFYLLIPAGLFFLLMILPNQIFYLFFTKKFAQTAPITKSLSIPYILYSIGNLPLLFILYTLRKPIYILLSYMVFFAVTTIGCYYLIPIKGVFAPSYVLGLAFFLSTAILAYITIATYKKLPKDLT